MSNDQIDELYGKGSIDKLRKYHTDAASISTDSYDAKQYHSSSMKRAEQMAKREKAKSDIKKSRRGSTTEKGWRNYLDAKDKGADHRRDSRVIRKQLGKDDLRIHNIYVKARGVQEDAPTVNAGSGNIAGIGVGAKGEPGVSPRHQPKKNKSVANPIVASMMRRRSPVMEQQLDELSRKTLSNYIKKASDNRAKNQGDFDFYYKKKNSKKYGKAFRNVLNRRKGIRTATDKLVKEETFAGAAIFEVSSKLFHNITLQKRKGKHWRTYLEEDDCYAEIREWARKHPKGKIVVRNESTGEMRYVRY